LSPLTSDSNHGQRTLAIATSRCSTTIVSPAAIVAQNGDAPTTARLSTAAEGRVTQVTRQRDGLAARFLD